MQDTCPAQPVPLVRELPLPEADVQAAVAALGLDIIQARNHVRCRMAMLALLAGKPTRLG